MPTKTASAKRLKLNEERLNTLKVLNRIDALKKKRSEGASAKKKRPDSAAATSSGNAHLRSSAQIERVFIINDPAGINSDFIEITPIQPWRPTRRDGDLMRWLNTSSALGGTSSQTATDDEIAHQKLINSVRSANFVLVFKNSTILARHIIKRWPAVDAQIRAKRLFRAADEQRGKPGLLCFGC